MGFTNSFGLPWPNFILHPWGSWTFYPPFTFFTFIILGLLWPILTFLHHILSMGLLLLYFLAPLGPSTSSRPICSFYRPTIHYSYHLGLMVFFFYPLTNSFLPILLGFFFLLGFQKWLSTLGHWIYGSFFICSRILWMGSLNATLISPVQVFGSWILISFLSRS